MRYIYGPVKSRRLGNSLGVDITPDRVCSFNCIYCEEGSPTRHLTINRDEYAPTDQIIYEITQSINRHKNIDYITFSGAGEPTLHCELGQILKSIKQKTDIPVAVITNSSILYQTQVRKELTYADLLVPSLDAISPVNFQKINRPNSHLQIDNILEGIYKITEEFHGTIFLEILLLSSLNDTKTELQKLAHFVNQLKVNKIQLNTVTRTTTEQFANRVSTTKLFDAQKYFTHPVEIYD